METTVTLGYDFDMGAWPGPLADEQAVVGETWLGPMGLLDLLETRLGLGGEYLADPIRAAALLPALSETEGFWSASAARDPLGAAKEVLRWRDTLWLHGWRGQPVSRRLEELARVTATALPGCLDRLATVASALGTASVGISRVVLCDEPGDFGQT